MTEEENMGAKFLQDVPGKKAEIDQGGMTVAENEEMFLAIADAITDTIVIVDSRCRIRFWSRSAERMFGYSPKEALGKVYHELIVPEHNRDQVRKGFGQFRLTGRGPFVGKVQEVTGVDSGGREIPLEISLGALRVKDQWWAVAAMRDISRQHRNRERLRVSVRRLEEAQRIAKMGNWEIDIRSGASCWSDEAYRIAGLEPQEVSPTGALFLEMIHPDDREQAQKDYRTAVAGRTPYYETKFRLLLKDGTIKHVREHGRIEYDHEGKPVKIFGTIQDVSAFVEKELQLERLAERLQLAIQGAKLGIWDWDVKQDKLFWDESMCMLYGVDKTFSGIREDFYSMIYPDDRETVKSFTQQVLRGERDYRINFRIQRPNGSIGHMRSLANVHRDKTGAAVRIVGVNYDISETVLAQEELSALNQELTNQVDERTKELTQAKMAAISIMQDANRSKALAVEATRAKSDFLANMSHEIRTPMNAVLGLSHLTLKTELSAKQHDYLSKIQSSAKSLLGIINDILDFSKIEAGKLEIEMVDFDLEQVLNHLSGMVTIKTRGKGLELLFSLPDHIPLALRGDPHRLGQVLINLLNNAVKFTEHGEIVLSVEIKNQAAGQITLRFSVRDTGIGMTPEQVKNLFQAFSQADASTTRKYGGTGLGLTISKRLVEMMGGKITADSVEGIGSTFSFTTLFGLQSTREKKRRILPEIFAGLKALVVDYQRTSREILREMLESFKLTVSVADSGESCLAELRKAAKTGHPFDLVLMDYQMPSPNANGLEILSRINGDVTRYTSPAVIIVSAHDRDKIQHQAAESGVDGFGFLGKPVTASALLETIMQVLGIKSENVRNGAPKATAVVEQLKAIQGARILLVEDNKINQQVAREILEQAGLVVEIANDGREAVEMAEKNPYDIILMDIQMPVMDGKVATVEIRKRRLPAITNGAVVSQRATDIPIIAMTAHAMVGDREKSLEAGMNDHISKPIDPDELYACLVRWVQPGKRTARAGGRTRPQEEQQEFDFPAHIPGIDLKTGLKRVSGNKKLFLSLLREYRQENKNFREQVLEAFAAGEIETAQRLVHTLKGVSGNIGARELQEKALELETVMKKQPENVRKMVDDTWSVLQAVLAGLQNALPAAEEPGSFTRAADQKVAGAALAARIAELKMLLKNGDMEAETVFLEIKETLFSLHPEAAAQLDKALDSLDFKEALKSLESIEAAGGVS